MIPLDLRTSIRRNIGSASHDDIIAMLDYIELLEKCNQQLGELPLSIQGQRAEFVIADEEELKKEHMDYLVSGDGIVKHEKKKRW